MTAMPPGTGSERGKAEAQAGRAKNKRNNAVRNMERMLTLMRGSFEPRRCQDGLIEPPRRQGAKMD
jgi:hypothetical protein